MRAAATAQVALSVSLTLAQREARLTIKRVQVLRLDEVQPCLRHPTEQRDDLRGRDAILGQEATPPVIGAEGLRQATRPHFDTAVGDHRQLQPSAGARLDSRAQDVRLAAPIEKNVNTNQLLLGGLARSHGD